MSNIRTGVILFTEGRGLSGELQHVFEGGTAGHVAAVWYNLQTGRHEVIEQLARPVNTPAQEWIVDHIDTICAVGEIPLTPEQAEWWNYEAARKLAGNAWYDIGAWLGFAFRPLSRILGRADRDTCTELFFALVVRSKVADVYFPGMDRWRISPSGLMRYVGKTIPARSIRWLTE